MLQILDQSSSSTTWDDVVGLEYSKHSIQQTVVWPTLRCDVFKGLLNPVKGMLLYGPPGTGKTLIGTYYTGQAIRLCFEKNIMAELLFLFLFTAKCIDHEAE